MKRRVTVVGAGPVGILTAIGLSKAGFAVQLLERMTQNELYKRADCSKLSRLYAISLGSYEIMKDVVGINFDTKKFQPINQIFINDGKANTIFEPKEINEAIFGYMVEESDLFVQLIKSLDNCSNNLNVIYGVTDLEILDNVSHPHLSEGALSLRHPAASYACGRDSQRLTCAQEGSIGTSSDNILPTSNTAPVWDALQASHGPMASWRGHGAMGPGSSPEVRSASGRPVPGPAGPSLSEASPRPYLTDSRKIFLRVGGEFLESDLIFATDGRNSAFRKRLPFSENKRNYNELALIFKIRHRNFQHKGLAVETFFPSGPFAILPHKEQDLSSIVWSAKKEKIEAFLSLNRNAQHLLITEKLPDFYSTFKFDSEFITYPLHLNILDTLYYKNVLLLGDSSHVVHPVAGQGFNLGIRDIRDILHIVKDYNFYTDTEHMFDEYQKLRKRDISKLANSTDFLSDLFSNNNMLLKGARRLGLDIFDMLPKRIRGMRSNAIKYAAGK